MQTYKVTTTHIIVNHLTQPSPNKIEYYIGNNTKRKIVINDKLSLGTNIIKYENSLILSTLSDSNKNIYWYTGVSELIINGNYAKFQYLY